MIIDVLKNEFHCMTFEGADVQEVLEVVSTYLGTHCGHTVSIEELAKRLDDGWFRFGGTLVIHRIGGIG